MFTNFGRYDIRGLEASIQHRVSDTWSTFGGVTVLAPTLDSLPYSPTRSLVLGVTGARGALRLSMDAKYQSSMLVLSRGRTLEATNTERVDGFMVVNLRSGYALPQLSGRGELFVAVENLFDQSYAYRPGYPMPGVSFQLGLSLARQSQ
jgi:iron complex outermembrane receptor protein